MNQKYTFQICQKFAIAAALAATLCCLPAAAQTNQANETLILNDKPMTYADFLKTYPDQAIRSKVLATLDRKTKNAFRDWEMAQLNKINAEKTALLEAKKEELVEITAALDLQNELKAVLLELAKELAAPKRLTPEQRVINKQRAATTMTAMAHPLIGGKFKDDLRATLESIAKRLHASENFNSIEMKVIKLFPEIFSDATR